MTRHDQETLKEFGEYVGTLVVPIWINGDPGIYYLQQVTVDRVKAYSDLFGLNSDN